MVSDMGPGPIVVTPAEAEFIKRIHEENRSFYSSDLGQAALRDLQQTFPHHWLYVGELLQNAVDAGAKHIRVAAIPEGFLFEHDGTPFEPEHVRALCARGLSTKGAGTVGFMGIGFKAVFQSFERAAISSGHWRFGFTVKEETGEYGERLRDMLGCVIPEHVDAAEPSPGMQCRFVLTDRLARLGSVHDDVANVLSSDLLVLALLAQRGVEELSWNGQRWQLTKTTHPVDECTSRLVLSAREEGTGEVRAWVLFSATYQPSRDAIARFLEHRQIRPRPEEREKVYAEAARTRTVDVFCPLDTNGVPVPPKRGHAYALLSTGATVPIGLHVQADWLLNTSRRELMDVETNAWHQEILSRLSGLLRAYLSWVCTLSGLAESRLSEAFGVLPSWEEEDGALGSYVQGKEFKDSLRAALADLSFLPVRTSEGTRFVTPGVARLLPAALRGFDVPAMRPWVLFGDDIISTKLLGERMLSSLDQLGILQVLTPADLVTLWEAGAVGVWRDAVGEAAKDAHSRLLRALAVLDSESSWRDARLCCLPTASGGWIDRRSAVGLPKDWGFVPEEEPAIRSWFEPCLPAREVRLEWEFDRSVQRDTGVQGYLDSVRREVLDSVFGKWWESLPRTPSEEVCVQVLAVTSWVRNKQKQQPGLVKRVLCVDGAGIALVPFGEAVLAEPYATSARRYFYPESLPVSVRYIQYEPGSSEANWRSFFEEASTAIRGPFRLVRSVKELSGHQLTRALPGYAPPQRRAVSMRASWEGVRFSSDNYLLVDPSLPEELTRTLAGEITHEVATAVRQWLDEARQVLLADPKIRVVYVAYNSSSVYRALTGFVSSWVVALQGAQWLYGTNGSGPYAPEQVLPRPDPARPDAVVAELPAVLVKTLEDCGVRFGTVVPDVLSLERLHREGPSASVERVAELLVQAIGETAQDPKAREELVVVLRSVALFPVPPGAVLIDGASRVSADRFVVRSGRGSDLGGWLLSTDAITKDGGEQGPLARLVGLLTSVFDLPPVPTGSQALALLEWVWKQQPEAEGVRRTLPRLYRLVLDELQSGGLQEGRVREHAMVYVASRRWVSVKSEDLYLDDLGEDRLKALVGGLLLATPGHLGETPDEQRRVAGMLGIRLLSTRFGLHLRPEGDRVLPAGWLESLRAIVDLAYAFARDENEEAITPVMPDVRYFARLQKSLVDNGAVTHSWEVRAARDGGRILLSGEPREFMADLCRVLLQWAGLSGRRDLDDLAPTITQLIVYLGSPEAFAQRLAEIRVERGMTPPPAPATRTPTPPAPTPPDPAPAPPAGPTPTTGGGRPTSAGGPLEHGGPSPEPAGGGEPPSEPGPGEPLAPPPASGGYTADDRERRLQAVRKKRAESNAKYDAQERELLGTGPLPPEEPEEPPGEGGSKGLASDVSYRQAVVDFERANGRYAEAKDAGQPGFDIDSYDRPLDDPVRRLVRRIEVKGHGCAWSEDETAELSDRQFLDAFNKKAEGVTVADDFDYWLYVVERRDDASLHVLPIRNPSRRAAKFEFRAGTWRALAEETPSKDGDGGEQRPSA